MEDTTKEKPLPEGLTVRYTQPQDVDALKEWFKDPTVQNWFPMCNDIEVDDAARRWVSFCRIKSSLTSELNGKPVGIVTLYLQAYKKLLHQTEFGIIVSPQVRNMGIGTFFDEGDYEAR